MGHVRGSQINKLRIGIGLMDDMVVKGIDGMQSLAFSSG